MSRSKTPGTPIAADLSATFNHAGLLALSKELKRPLYTLEVTQRDPFIAGQASRRAAAEWFAELWQRFDIQPGAHLRRIHYLLVSQEPGTVLMPDGSQYVNVDRPCYNLLNTSSLDARYLGLVPADDLVDRRNDDPVIYLPDDAAEAALTIAGGLLDNELSGFEIPTLELSIPTILQRYHTEIWCEKTTMNDVLLPLCQRFGINLITGWGELSLTACVNLVKRAVVSGRPVRILYLSDFDPAAASMPVAVSRKIEHTLYSEQLHELDIHVRPIVLTHDQCVRYRLPRTPIKETESRAAVFEARFGEGATELDALEALHPGELARILTQEIRRYYDFDLAGRIEEVGEGVQAELDDINAEVRKRYAKELRKLEEERNKALAAIDAFEKKASPVLRKIERDLEAEAPDVDAGWPEPDEGDEDPDPLFDSTREFVEQVDRYKEHQGKPIEAKPRKPRDSFPTVCTVCGRSFQATKQNKSMTCGGTCLATFRYRAANPKADPIPCRICGEPFQSIRGATVCPKKDCRNAARRKSESQSGPARS
jgi:hypothetical protein